MIQNNFIGTWKLLFFEVKDSENKISLPFGSNPIGFIMYNEDGYMSVCIMKEDRPKFAAADYLDASVEERAKAFEGYISYCGKYEIGESKIVHYPEVMYIPNFVNVPQERYYTFLDNKLMLSTLASPIGGKIQSCCLTWERVGNA